MENWGMLKGHTKKDPFRGKNKLKELLLEDPDTSEWSHQEIMGFEQNLLGTINLEALIPQKLLNKLLEKNILSLDDWSHRDLYWFMIIDAIPKLTKNKRSYLLLSGTGSNGKMNRIFCWGVPKDCNLNPYTFCVAEIDKNDFGMSTNWNKIKTFNP